MQKYKDLRANGTTRLSRDESFGDELVGTKSMPRGAIFDIRGGMLA